MIKRRAIGKIPWDKSHTHLRVDVLFKFDNTQFLEIELNNFRVFDQEMKGHNIDDIKFPESIKIRLKTNTTETSQKDKDDSLFVFSLIILPFYVFSIFGQIIYCIRFSKQIHY